jgi:citrate lyase subunit beta/citryl-CoA lyase
MRMRSVLFTPGDRADRFTKALTEGKADVVVADLEDAVAPENKAAARRQVAAALESTKNAKSARAVRINPWQSSHAKADLEAIMAGKPDLLAVAKVESPEEVRELDAALAKLEVHHHIPPDSTRLMLHLETGAGVWNAREIALASPRVLALAFGAEDLAADVGLRRSKGNSEVAVARALVPIAAAAAKVVSIDMITADYEDLERCATEAVEARALGYVGKMCIHPMQVPAIHEGFRPTPGEIAWAKKVQAAVEKAGVGEGGVVVVDGRMIDVPLIRQARRIMDDAK